MFDKIKNVVSSTNFQEDLENSKSTLEKFGVKIFKGDKVIWLVFVILCVISLV